ncbi:hypothetical protein [Terrabacter terrae]|uniref:hypothetical protein n=1 Tax=Terrabacter terrae TaxID=318434 RepID=UPI0031E19E55
MALGACRRTDQPAQRRIGARRGHLGVRLRDVPPQLGELVVGVGDPAPDLAPALWTFTGEARAAYRDAVALDDATWVRACGWALAPSLTGIGHYRHTFPRMAEHGRRMVQAAVGELLGTGAS